MKYQGPIFFATVQNKMDSKERATMPSEQRESFSLAEARDMQSRLYLVLRELDGVSPHLACFGRNMIEGLVAELDYCDDARAHEIECILANTDSVRFDAAGRFSIGSERIALLGLKETLTFVGVGRFYEIWNPKNVLESRSAQVSFYRRALRINTVPKHLEQGEKS